jgi:quinol monooxygenase YgiN
MSDPVSWTLELEPRPGRAAEARGLLAEIASFARAHEPGTLAYEWSSDSEETLFQLHERYVDSPAVITHLASFGEKFGGRLLDVLTPGRFVVHGSPSPEVRAAVAGFNPVYMTVAGGFTR